MNQSLSQQQRGIRKNSILQVLRNPCDACRIKHKKCVWNSDEAKACDRCIKLEFDCNSVNRKEIAPSEDDIAHLQNWSTTIKQLEAEMQQLEGMKGNLATKQQSHVQWRLSVTNGVLKLETPIHTIEELAMFSKASLRYLSPFTGLFKRQPIRFESQAISLTLGLTTAMERHELVNPRRKQFALLDNNDTNQILQSSTPADQSTIDYLVSMYLKRFNNIYGSVHEATFLKHYHSLDNPMDSVLTLGVCIDALVQIRHLLKYSAKEICILSRVFYSRCKDLLFDMYEDPSQKLSIVIATSLLLQYLTRVLLSYLEANHLVTMALLLCPDLAKRRDYMTPVERALFQRHYFHLEMLSRTLKVLYQEKVDFTKPEAMEVLETLDDETEETKEYIALLNHMFRLVGSPYVSGMIGRLSNVFQGQPCELLLEDILQYEPLIKEWWASLPTEYQVCADPFDPNGSKLVQREVSQKFFPFFILHMMTGVFASSILQPNAISTAESTISMEAVHLLRKKSVSLALNSCKVLIYALDENWDPYTSNMPNFSLTVMLYVVYCLDKISACRDIQFPRELLTMLIKSLDTRSKALFPAGHIVPPSSSFLTSYLGNSRSLCEVYGIYDQYLFPGCSLVSDILFTSVNWLVDRHFTVTLR